MTRLTQHLGASFRIRVNPEREARQAAEDDLVRRQCGTPLTPSPSRRLIDGVLDEDPRVIEEVVRLWYEYLACQAHALGRPPLRRLQD